jgi:hypothetical protein
MAETWCISLRHERTSLVSVNKVVRNEVSQQFRIAHDVELRDLYRPPPSTELLGYWNKRIMMSWTCSSKEEVKNNTEFTWKRKLWESDHLVKQEGGGYYWNGSGVHLAFFQMVTWRRMHEHLHAVCGVVLRNRDNSTVLNRSNVLRTWWGLSPCLVVSNHNICDWGGQWLVPCDARWMVSGGGGGGGVSEVEADHKVKPTAPRKDPKRNRYWLTCQ